MCELQPPLFCAVCAAIFPLVLKLKNGTSSYGSDKDLKFDAFSIPELERAANKNESIRFLVFIISRQYLAFSIRHYPIEMSIHC